VLTARQQRIKEQWLLLMATGCMKGSCSIRCARYRGAAAELQARVTGQVHLLLRPGALFIEGWNPPTR